MQKATHKTKRNEVTDFEQIMNVGISMADDFRRLGFERPIELKGKDPWRLYVKISKLDGEVHDPCVLDCYLSVVNFMNGQPPQKWWKYTPERKRDYSKKIARLKTQF